MCRCAIRRNVSSLYQCPSKANYLVPAHDNRSEATAMKPVLFWVKEEANLPKIPGKVHLSSVRFLLPCVVSG